jgi:hypothetical protein
MSVTRVPSLLEQSYITMQGGLAPAVRTNLGCASSQDVSAALVPMSSQITSISAVNTTQTAQIAALSGADVTLRADIAAVSAGLATAGIPRSEVADISAGLATDIYNVDAQLTLLQADSIIISGATTAATGSATWFNVVISGGNIYKIGLYAS